MSDEKPVGVIRPMPDWARNVRLRLSNDELAHLYGIVDMAQDGLEEAGLTLDPSGDLVASIVISTMISVFLEQHKAVLEEAELRYKTRRDE